MKNCTVMLKFAMPIISSLSHRHHCKGGLCFAERASQTHLVSSVNRPRPTLPAPQHQSVIIDPSAKNARGSSIKCSPLSNTFIDGKPLHCRFNHNDKIKSFRHSVCSATDVSMRPMLFLQQQGSPHLVFNSNRKKLHDLTNSDSIRESAQCVTCQDGVIDAVATYGQHVQHLQCRWGKKFYGQVTFGPRNFPYASSRWLARRYQMKKHRILKRYRFRRYKLAAVANLPFSKLIRVGMLPQLKSSKTKKGDAVDAVLTSQLVGMAKGDASNKVKGRRSRPKSKYQV